MLLRFRCKNFRSFRDEQEISLVAARERSEAPDKRLIETKIKGVSGLRCAAIYGSNGSGKSNLLKAMAQFSLIISASQKRWDSSDKIPVWDPFMLDENSRSSETEYEASVVIDDVEYRYGFRLNETAISEEWLYEYSPNERTLFRRKTTDGRVVVDFIGRNLTGGTLETIRQLTRPNSLFLSAAAQNNYERLAVIQKWFVDRFNMISGQECTQMLPFTANLCKQSGVKEPVKKLISFADVGIVDFEVVDEDAPESFKKMYAAMLRAAKEVSPETADKMGERESFVHSEVRMMHRGAEGKLYPLTTEQESRGTLSYFSVLGPLLDELKSGSILLIDELESSMHPLLVRQLVRVFNDPDLNPKGAQVIFSTHNTGILDPGILRRDQVWLTEKNQEGATTVYPLTSFKPRKDQNIEAAYLHGRFGAIPFLDSELLASALGSGSANEGCKQSGEAE
jgi:AAA15 family ATPase/GTPase